MPRRAAGLSAAKVRTATPGRYGDGDGLYLLVRTPETAFWVFRFTRAGRLREAGLGRARGANAVALAEARDRARELHRMVRAGRDPLADRAAAEAKAKADAQHVAVKAVTFRSAADFYLASHAASWRNAKHRAQWGSTLETYAHPHLGDVPTADVATGHVLAALEPIWRVKPETAARLRGRIEAVLDYARARGWREGENPAAWRGHLCELLPSRAKIAPTGHHAALPWKEAGAFLTALRAQPGIGARALELAILTAARSGEVLGATWGELDLGAKVWTVPGSRMKGGREHRVPLSAPVLAVLAAMAKLQGGSEPAAHVFPGGNPGKPLSAMAMTMVLRRMKRADVTVHGFRSTFRDWTAEQTDVAREVAEAALAHANGDKVEAAYLRSDFFEKRRKLMEVWARYCGRASGL